MTASALEDKLLWLIKYEGIALPQREYRFAPPRKWRFDFAWPDKGVAVEVEGGVYVRGRHQRPKGFENDCEKYNEACLRGWRVLRFTDKHIKSGVAIKQIMTALDWF